MQQMLYVYVDIIMNVQFNLSPYSEESQPSKHSYH